MLAKQRQTWFISVVALMFILSACSSTEQKTTSKPVAVTPTTPVEQPVQTLDSLDGIAKMFADSNDIDGRNSALLRLAYAHQQNGECTQSDIIVKHLIDSNLNAQQQSLAHLLLTNCAFERLQNSNTVAEQASERALIERWIPQIDIQQLRYTSLSAEQQQTLSMRYALIKAQLYAQDENYRVALQTLLSVERAGLLFSDAYAVELMWEWLAKSDISGREQLGRNNSDLANYVEFLSIIENANLSVAEQQAAIIELHSASADTALLPQQVQRYIQAKAANEKRIAVLLPLSGRLKGQGEAIKQGVLAAYFEHYNYSTQSDHQAISLEFIDTGSNPQLSDSIDQAKLAEFGTIIGPLLKSHIQRVNTLVLPNVQMLSLNQVTKEGAESSDALVMFALSPEQEAKQLALLMHKQGIKKPVLVRNNSRVSSRMAEAFLNEWTSASDDSEQQLSPQQIPFTDNASMRVGIRSALDVTQSQKRISQINNLSEKEVLSVTRNRRDVDAFVVFANPNEIELINPIIESSISLFSNKQIPVFATSYSYDHKQSKNSQRDLRNLVFTDMPWLLPDGRNSRLSRNVDGLMNRPSSTFLRLFAFGYDALTIANDFARLNSFPHISIAGLSGELHIDPVNQVARELSFIEIDSEQ